jgi:hemerythrin
MAAPNGWNDNLSTGFASIDEEHQKLFSLLNELGDACDDGNAAEVVVRIIDELISYTRYHFHREELLLAERKYALLEEHKQLHADLKAEVQGYRDELAKCSGTSYPEYLGRDIVVLLEKWLINHIMVMDVPALRGEEDAEIA